MAFEDRKTLNFGFFLTEGFSLPAYTAIAETFRIANDVANQALFNWFSMGKEAGLIRSASGLQVQPDADISQIKPLDQLAVISSIDSHQYEDKAVFKWLRQLDQKGVALGGITSGCWLLAKAGLLKDYRFTLHWQELEGFKERYPELQVSHNTFEIDRRRFSCASGFAALDMVLHMIGASHGHELAQSINARLIHQQRQMSEQPRSLHGHVQNTHVATALDIMSQHIEQPLNIEAIAAATGLSKRQLGRLFIHHINRSPQSQYMTMRLDRAASLLKLTSRSITEIAIAVGFEHSSHFCQSFKQLYLQTPKAFRKQRQL